MKQRISSVQRGGVSFNLLEIATAILAHVDSQARQDRTSTQAKHTSGGVKKLMAKPIHTSTNIHTHTDEYIVGGGETTTRGVSSNESNGSTIVLNVYVCVRMVYYIFSHRICIIIDG